MEGFDPTSDGDGCGDGFILVHGGELFRGVASIFETLRDRAGARGVVMPWRYVSGARFGFPAYAVCRGDLVRTLCGPSGDNLRVVQSGNQLGTLSLQTADQSANLRGRPYIDISLGKIMDPGRQELDFRKTRSSCKTGGLILCSCSRATGNPWPLTN